MTVIPKWAGERLTAMRPNDDVRFGFARGYLLSIVAKLLSLSLIRKDGRCLLQNAT